MMAVTFAARQLRRLPGVGLGRNKGRGVGVVLGLVANLAMAQHAIKTIAPQLNNTPATIHLIAPGDTLWALSKRYYGQALRWQDISYDNHIPEPRLLQPGAILLLRAAKAGVADSASVEAVTGDVRLMVPVASVSNAMNAMNRLTAMKTRLFTGKAGAGASVPMPVVLSAGALINKGDIVPVGATLKTGPDSFLTLLMPHGSRATLPSNSQVKLVRFKDAKGQPSVLLDLNAGQVDARVQHSDDPSAKPSYRIRTRLATIGARGTYFRVALPDAQHMLVGVLEGTVAANWGAENNVNDQSQVAKPSAGLLAVGQGSVLQQGTAPGLAYVQNLLPAPVLQDANAPQNQGDVLVHWLPVPGAVAYRVQMAKDADFNDLIAQQNMAAQSDIQTSQAGSTETYKTWFSKLDKGSYFVRVSAIAVDGLEGLFALSGFTRVSYEVSGAVALAANSAQLEFSWTPLPGSNYWLELAEDNKFSSVVLSVPNLLGHTVRITALPPGQYFWRVKANVQEHGQTTMVMSKTMPVRVGGVL